MRLENGAKRTQSLNWLRHSRWKTLELARLAHGEQLLGNRNLLRLADSESVPRCFGLARAWMLPAVHLLASKTERFEWAY
jgi:hypothetical protein